MAKAVGYIISLVGLLVILASNKIATLGFLSGITKALVYIITAGVALIVVGLVLVSDKSSGKVKQAEEEVPIYEGEGKKRKIVGYRKASKK